MKNYYSSITVLCLSIFFTNPSQKTVATPELMKVMSKITASLPSNDQVDFLEALHELYAYKKQNVTLSQTELSDYQAVLLKAKFVFTKLFKEGIFPEDEVALHAFDEEFSEDIWDEDDDIIDSTNKKPYDANTDKLNHFNNFFENEVDPEMFLMKLIDFFQFKAYLEKNISDKTTFKTELDSAEKTALLKFKKFFPGKTYPLTINQAQSLLNNVQEALYPSLNPTSSFPPAPALPSDNSHKENECPPCLPSTSLTPDVILKNALELPYSEVIEALSHAHNPQLPENKNFSSEEKEFLKQLNTLFNNFENLIKKTISSKSFSDKKTNAELSTFIKNKLLEMTAFI